MENNEDEAESSQAIARAGDGELSTKYGDVVLNGQSTLLQGDFTQNNHYYPSNPTNPDESEEREEAKKREILLESLLFDRCDARFRNVMIAMDGTCQWFCKLDAFQSWLELGNSPKHDGFLWLKGKPGSGKSTIMKEAVTWVKRTIPDQVIVSYFFNARSPYELEKSSLGLFRWLTDQLLKEYSAGISDFTASFSSKLRDGKLVEPWTLTELYNFLLQLISMPRFPHVIIFIDALDEGNEDDVRFMIDMLLSITQQAQSASNRVKICVSSRHYPNISIDRSMSLVVEDQLQHKLDIRLYVDRKLAGGFGPQMTEFRHRVCERANSIFLWVVLVVPMLNKLHDQGRNLSFRNKQLDKIPRHLHAVFEELMCRDADDIQETMSLFRWVLFSVRPLSPHELYAATQISSLAVDDMPVSFNEAEDNVLTEETARKALLHYSRGLVEVVYSFRSEIMQFIHETVRDFLLGKNQFNTNAASRAVPASDSVAGFGFEASHLQIAEDCLRYLTVLRSEVQSPVSSTDEYPLISYAASNWWKHIQVVDGKFNEELLGLVVELFLNKTKYSMWMQACREGCDIDVRDPLQNAHHTDPPLYYAAAFGFAELVSIMLDRGANVNAGGGSYDSAVAAAVHFGREKVLRLLLDAGANPNIFTAIPAERKAYGTDFRNPLQLAVDEGGSRNVVQMLLEAGADVHQPHRCLLRVALSKRDMDMDVVKMLVGAHVRSNSNAQADYHFSKTSCFKAAFLGIVSREKEHLKLVNMFIDAGADVNAQRGVYGNSLHAASGREHDRMIEALIDAGANVNTQGKHSHALHTASSRRYDGVIENLINKGADTNTIECGKYGNALEAALCKGHDGIVQVLIEAGADVNAQGGVYGNPLQAAAIHGNSTIVKLLLDAGADMNAQGGQYCNALQAASYTSEQTRTVKVLLEAGANVNAQGGFYGNALQAAACSRQSVSTVEVLLEAGADVNAQGGSFGNAFEAALRCRRYDTAKVLLRANVSLAACGDFSELLREATERGYPEIADMVAKKEAASKRSRKRRRSS